MTSLKKKALMIIATLCTLVASMVATSACFLGFYQPEEPECLREM